MSGFSLNGAETARLQEIVADCREVGDDPIPWPVLDGLRALLHTDDVSLGGYCTAPSHAWFENGVGSDGKRYALTETPEEALGNPFWLQYWQSSCSYPDRSGDYDSVTTMSDFHTMPQVRGIQAADGLPFQREIMAVTRLGPTRQLRVLGWRTTGSDFTERDRFFLTLLRPHIADHYTRWVRAHPPSAELTPRQLAVLDLVRDGYTNLQIGRRLNLSEGTVRTHLNHVYERLGVASRTAAVTAVYDSVPAAG